MGETRVLSVIAIYRQLMSLGCGKLGNHMLRAHHIASFLGLVFSLSLMTPCEGQDGASLFHQMRKVLGGKAKIAAINRFEQCVRAEAWDETGKSHGVVYKRTRWTKPTVLRLDQVGAGDTYVLFFNGVSGWEILPDKGLVELTGDELAFAEGYAKGVDINLWLADDDINNLLASSKDHVISRSVQHPVRRPAFSSHLISTLTPGVPGDLYSEYKGPSVRENPEYITILFSGESFANGFLASNKVHRCLPRRFQSRRRNRQSGSSI
jgi:hypothetical protein